MRIINTITEDLISLHGILYEGATKDEIFIFIPGIMGNFVDNSFIEYIGMELQKNNYNFLGANTRGSYSINYSFLPNSVLPPRQIGVAFEKFNECLYDINSWINTVVNMGFKKISLIGHSFGCNKIIYYMNNINNPNIINMVIFISPNDEYYIFKNKAYYHARYEYAKKMINQGNKKQLIEYSFFYKTSENLIYFLDDNSFDNFPILSKKTDKLEQLRNIKKTISIIAGEEEKDIIRNINFISNNFIEMEFNIVKNANHSYNGAEELLSKKVIDIIHKKKVMKIR